MLIDDIVSTGHTMMETISHLKNINMPIPVCIGVHAVFANDAYSALKNAGVEHLVTCNTLPHPSNGIDLSILIANGIRKQLDFIK